MMLTIPDLSTLSMWLNQISIESYQCGYCDALHIAHLKKLNDVFDAKVELIDDIIFFTIIAEIKPSAISPLMAELSQINSSSNFVKAYLDIPDEAYPKIIFRHSLNCSEGVTTTQFASFIASVEEEALQIISELNSYDLLSYQDNLADDVEVEEVLSHTYH